MNKKNVFSGSGRPAVLGVVIPAFQVAPCVADVIRAVPSSVDHIIVVDDASTDNLTAALESIRDERLQVRRHTRNRGVGGATMTGYEAAVELGCDLLVKLDGDGQMDPALIPKLIEPILTGEADYAKGNRFLHFRELKQMPAVRRVGNFILTFLAKCASGYWPIFDPTNGFTALHRLTWERLRKDYIAPRYFFEISLLIELGCQRAVVRDVSLPARYGEEASFLSPPKVAVEFPLRLLVGMIRRLKRWYFLYDFTPVSLFLIFGTVFSGFSVGWGGYHWAKSVMSGVAAATGTIMLAVVFLILGVQLLLQALALDIQNVPRQPLQGERHRHSE